jgi:hypothetical protein
MNKGGHASASPPSEAMRPPRYFAGLSDSGGAALRPPHQWDYLTQLLLRNPCRMFGRDASHGYLLRCNYVAVGVSLGRNRPTHLNVQR